MFTNISAEMGTQILSANALMIEVFLFTISFIEGFGLAAESLTGNFVGQGKRDRLPSLVGVTVGTGVLFALIFSGISIGFTHTVFGILTNQMEIINEIKIYVFWLLPLLVFNAIAFRFDGYFIGLNNTAVIRNSALLGFFFGFIPLSVLAWFHQDNHILWLSLVILMIVRTLYINVLFIKEMLGIRQNNPLYNLKS
nr:MATE family efflux transporter [Moorena sp. SIO4G3]